MSNTKSGAFGFVVVEYAFKSIGHFVLRNFVFVSVVYLIHVYDI